MSNYIHSAHTFYLTLVLIQVLAAAKHRTALSTRPQMFFAVGFFRAAINVAALVHAIVPARGVVTREVICAAAAAAGAATARAAAAATTTARSTLA